MKKALLSLGIGLLAAGGLQAQTLFSEDFTSTSGTDLPSGWSMDPVTTTSWKTGTTQTLSSAYFPLPDVGQGRFVALNDDVDSSIHHTNNILMTSAIDLSNQTSVWVSFDLSYLGAAGSTGSPAESLTLEYSTDNGASWTVLETLTGNQTYWWEPRYIDLSTLAGQSNVKLGFRYGDGDAWMYGVGLDNLLVFSPPANDIELVSVSPTESDPSGYGASGATVQISGVVKNMGTTPISSYTINYQQGSNPVVSETQTASIAPFATGTFSVDYTIPGIGEYPLNVWVSLTGDNNNTNDSGSAFVSGVDFMPTKRLVFEEATGTWCGWCPRGSFKMKEFAEQHPGVAAQIAVHNSDPMEVAAYDALISSFVGGSYPNLAIDRESTDDPGNIEAVYQAQKEKFGFAEVTLGSPSVSGTDVSVPVNIKPAVSISGAKLALVITEDGVTGTGSGWPQTNYYSGGASGPMGGYENLPDPVEDEVYEFVARSITPSPDGAASGLPATLDPGSSYDATLTATLDASWDQDNLTFIVLLIGANGNILNSDFSGSTTAIANVDAGLNNAVIYPNPSRGDVTLDVNALEATDAVISITDVMGRTVTKTIDTKLLAGFNSISLHTGNLANGMYLVHLDTKKGQLIFKLQILK